MPNSRPKSQIRIFSFALLLFAAASAFASECDHLKPTNIGTRRLSPGNPGDWAYMKCEAESGKVFRQFYVGIALVFDIGVEGYRPKEGIAWLTKAASADEPNAQKMLAKIYFEGEHIDKDIELAYQWHYLATKHEDFLPNDLKEIDQSIPEEKKTKLREKALLLLKK